jgi:L-alanine-DL-glutamate epimerase-like enolase superfamily enzyme
MILSDLEFHLVQIPCVGQEPPVRCLVVRLATETGLEGWGETQVDWRPSELEARRNAVLPMLAGRSAYDIEDLLHVGALRFAPLRTAIEMACWDLVGRAAGEPLCHLFGGSYRRQVPLSVRVAGPTPRYVARLSRELAEQGFHSQTIASSGHVEQDLDTLAAVRQMLPDRTKLRFDGAASFDFETAWELCSKLEGEPLQFVLDPLRSPDLTQTAALRRQTSVPLAVRRAIRGPADMIALVRSGAAPSAVIDLRQVGGLAPARKCAAVAEAAGLGASLSVGPSLGVSVAAMLQLAAATPAYAGCNECAVHQLQDDLLVEPLEIVDGMLPVPQGPGLGVEVDRAKLERYQVTG